MKPRPSPSIHETLTTILSAEDDDAAFLIGGAINIYSEAMRRRANRILWGPGDVRALFSICRAILEVPDVVQNYQPSRSARPTAEEERAILEGINEQIEEPEK